MTYTETIESLRCCFGFGTCSECKARSMTEEDPLPCKLSCKERIGLYAADLIERLTTEVADLRKELEWKDMVIAIAQRKQAEAEAERDALIEQIKERHDCLDCKHNDSCEFDGAIVFDCMNCVQEGCPCAECCDSSRWQWRGLPEAPEEGEKA